MKQMERDQLQGVFSRQFLDLLARRTFESDGAIVNVGKHTYHFDHWPLISHEVAYPVDEEIGEVPRWWSIRGRSKGEFIDASVTVGTGAVTVTARVIDPPLVGLLQDAGGNLEMIAVPVALMRITHDFIGPRDGPNQVKVITATVPGLAAELAALPETRGRRVAWMWRLGASPLAAECDELCHAPLRLDDDVTALVGGVEVDMPLGEWMGMGKRRKKVRVAA